MAKLPAIHAAAVAACDATDGLIDSLIEDPSTCAFDPATLLCKGVDSNTCLTDPQIAALKKLYGGPKNPRTGESIYPGWAPGGELGWTRSVVARNVTNLGGTYFSNLVFENPDWDYRTFNFDTDMKVAESKIGALADAIDPNLSAAKRRGVKIIQYHGWNDQTLQPGNSPDYYRRVAAAMGGLTATQDFLSAVHGSRHGTLLLRPGRQQLWRSRATDSSDTRRPARCSGGSGTLGRKRRCAEAADSHEVR